MKYRLSGSELNRLFTTLQSQGFRTLAPCIRDHAIIYDEVATAEELPVGWTDVQEKGSYRLERRNDQACFGYNVGAYSWRRFLDPPQRQLWSASRQNTSMVLTENADDDAPMALIGVRACELKAIKIQDRIYLQDQYQDQFYKHRREQAFIVAVNCVEAGNTCFCVSMSAGPEVEQGYDLVLTEVVDAQDHYFLLEAGSTAGDTVLGQLHCPPATPAEVARAVSGIESARQNMGRALDANNIKSLIDDNYEHHFWEEVAEQCLSCANCTLVCPTCFCSTVADITDLDGSHSERWQQWDSCFTGDFSYIHGGKVRDSTKSRYRQWMSHKLATWHDQFDSSGCVGCGRCISWCPVGIDITEGAKKLEG